MDSTWIHLMMNSHVQIHVYEIVCSINSSNIHIFPPLSIKVISMGMTLAGDLAFLAVIMGKENFSSSWCNWCKLTTVEWQNVCPVRNDMLWDIPQTNIQVDCNVENGFTDARMKWVQLSPMSSIPFSRIIFSGLHAQIGIGNRIIKHLEELIDIDVEIYLTKNSSYVHQRYHLIIPLKV